jgi:PAS domain S-box-containing protein
MAFKDQPIKRKLTALFLLTSGAVLLLTCTAYFAYDFVTFRQLIRGQLSTLGEAIAANSTAALAFGNERDAGEILAALKADRHIVAAGLYAHDGKLFSRYPADLTAEAFPAAPERDGYRFEGAHLVAFQPVAQASDKRLGTLYLKSDMEAMYERFRLDGGIVVGVAAASLLVGFAVSIVLQRQISEPILTLADTARAIADRRDYSVRATKQGEDELGLLTDAFNQMLTRIDEQDRALREGEERLNLALMSSGVGTWSWNVVENSITWDDYIHPLFGLEPKTFPGRFEDLLHLVHPDDRTHVNQAVAETLDKDAPYDTEYQVVWPNGTVRFLASRGKVYRDPLGRAVRMTGVSWDITQQKSAEKQLRALLDELARSNKELEQFAYVASHDLQEPLRMVSSFTQLLEQRYRDKLDDDAREFINYAVDGARRMQRLINDLLEFSRVSTRGRRLEAVDANVVLGTVRANLSAAIEEAGALVTNEELPTVMADPTQLGQLLQNLIGNAIKFHGDESPRVHVVACERPGEWIFAVKDNGIGIDPEYFDRIFVIFQRLQVTADYPGTGIGLAVCKRIVERHGGRIWVESEPGHGAIFSFAIPKSTGASEP